LPLKPFRLASVIIVEPVLPVWSDIALGLLAMLKS
jgi:hypothetical protein